MTEPTNSSAAQSSPSSVTLCAGCGLQLAPAMLACPRCQRLTHAQQLESLAAQAQAATTAGELTTALELWRVALELLPAQSKQRDIIVHQISRLGEQLSRSGAPGSSSSAAVNPTSNVPAGTSRAAAPLSGSTTAKKAGLLTSIGALGMLAWKSKILLAGLTKSTTLFSMLASLGVYWTMWGWKFALGLVLSIYVHEMGHIIQLRRYGFRTGAPTFIPGLGALIRLQQQVVNPREDADIGLAGPIYGLGAAIVSLALWQVTQQPIFAAIAGVGAWINLFNLLPFGSLDGGRGFHAMSRVQKIAATTCVALAWYFSGDGILVLVLIGCIVQLFGNHAKPPGYLKGTLIYCGLVLILTAISLVRLLEDAG